MTTIAQALSEATQRLRETSPTPRLDAELLLAHALGWGRARLLAEGRDALPPAALDTFQTLVARRAALEPVAYLVGRRGFYGLDFLVDRRVLVPRPETELLVELALAAARRTKEGGQRDPLLVADIGSGSGAIAVAVAVHLPQAHVFAVDLSPDALTVTRINAERHGVLSRITLLQGDLLAPLGEPVDLLLSNPPYTILAEIDEGVRRHEPHLALDGGPDGLDLYRRVLGQAPAKLRPGGIALLEIGATQAGAVRALAEVSFPQAHTTVHQDLAGHDRVIQIDTGAPSRTIT